MKYGLNPDGAQWHDRVGLSEQRVIEIRDAVAELIIVHDGKMAPIFEYLLDNFKEVELIIASMSLVTLLEIMMKSPEQKAIGRVLDAIINPSKDIPNY